MVAADDRQVLTQALLQTVRDALGYVVPTPDTRAPPHWLAVTTAALLGGFVRWRGAGATRLLRPA